jgi:isochorismate pyruvate lyase
MRDTIAIGERVYPEDCKSIDDVRGGVDALDRAIVALLTERQRYMHAAVPLQKDRSATRDAARIQAVFENVESAARASGLLEATARAVWTVLIQRASAYEAKLWDNRETELPVE